MANSRKDLVCMKVHRSFFDRLFEPERRKAENRLGIKLSQAKFTEFVAKSNMPICKPKQNYKFAPGGRLNFRL